MSHTLKQTIERISKISEEMKRISDLDLHELADPDYSSEDKYKAHLMTGIMSDIQDAYAKWLILNAKTMILGTLQKNSRGRYELSGFELTSGYPIEVWDVSEGFFIPTRIEFSTSDYYVTAWGPTVGIDGVTARVKYQ